MLRRGFLKSSALAAAGLISNSAWAAPAKSRLGAREKESTDLPPLGWIAWNRLAFGPVPGDLERFQRLAPSAPKRLERFLEEQLHPESIRDTRCDQLIHGAGWTTLSKPLRTLWADHSVEADRLKEKEAEKEISKGSKDTPGSPGSLGSPGSMAKAISEHDLRIQPAREVEAATWLRAVRSEKQLQEVLVDFWHNHFNVFAWEQRFAPAFAHYDRDVIRAHAFGNFREMLDAVAKSPSMLFYLDNHLNQSGNPNENYARELFELHTLGAENYLGTRDRDRVEGYAQGTPVGYVDGDVYEASRCFTGWKVDTGKNSGETGEFAYFEPWHDRFQKIVLGHPIQEYQPPLKDGHDVLDRLAQHPGTARFIARKLCRRLVCDEPPEGLVERAARVFHENTRAPDQIRKTVRTIVLSLEFSSTYGTKMKRPFEALAGTLRLLLGESEPGFFPTEPFLGAYPRLRQRLFNCRTPDGYPDRHPAWSGASALIERWKFNQQLVMGKMPGIENDLYGKTPASLRNNPRAFLEYWARRWTGRREVGGMIAPALRFATAEIPGGKGAPRAGDRQRLLIALALVLNSPEFQRR